MEQSCFEIKPSGVGPPGDDLLKGPLKCHALIGNVSDGSA
jgi:hypothetical protein